MAEDSQGNLDLLAGARLLDIDQTLDYQLSGDIGPLPLPGRQGSADVKLSNWDAIVGVKGRYSFGTDREWFIPYYIDIGTGQSRFTWQGIAGIGYRSSGVRDRRVALPRLRDEIGQQGRFCSISTGRPSA